MARAAANGEWQIGVVEHDDSSLLVRQGENRRGYICTLLPAARALGPSRLCAARCGDSTRCAKLTGSAAAAAHAPSSAVMLGALLLFVGVCASPRCVVFPRSQARGAVFTAPRPVFLCPCVRVAPYCACTRSAVSASHHGEDCRWSCCSAAHSWSRASLMQVHCAALRSMISCLARAHWHYCTPCLLPALATSQRPRDGVRGPCSDSRSGCTRTRSRMQWARRSWFGVHAPLMRSSTRGSFIPHAATCRDLRVGVAPVAYWLMLWCGVS